MNVCFFVECNLFRPVCHVGAWKDCRAHILSSLWSSPSPPLDLNSRRAQVSRHCMSHISHILQRVLLHVLGDVTCDAMRRSYILQRTCVKTLLRTNSSFLWLQSIKYFLCALYHWERMLRCKSKLCLLLCCGFLPLLSPLFCSVPRVSCSAALTAACSALLCCGFAERRVKYSITATLLCFPVLKYNISILVFHFL